MKPKAASMVWDPLVRLVHWSLAATIAIAWFTQEGGGAWHERVGYVALALVIVRIIWGFCGSATARFGSFVRSPGLTARYAAAVWSGKDSRHTGHNPLGAWMIVALLLTTLLVCLSGWLYTTDAYWGEAWLERVHDGVAVALLCLVALHVMGVVLTSYRFRENLVLAMITGRKRAQDEHQAPARAESDPPSV